MSAFPDPSQQQQEGAGHARLIILYLHTYTHTHTHTQYCSTTDISVLHYILYINYIVCELRDEIEERDIGKVKQSVNYLSTNYINTYILYVINILTKWLFTL